MKNIIQFIKYNNGAILILAFLVLGASALAATGNVFIGGVGSNQSATPTTTIQVLTTGTSVFSKGFISNASSSIGNNLNVSGALNASSTLFSSGNTYLGINAGLVGVGTNTPWAMFSVNPVAMNPSMPAFVVGSSSATSFIIQDTGRVGIGTTSPFGLFSINPNALGANVPSFVIGSSTATWFQIDNGGILTATKLSNLQGGFISNASSSIGSTLTVSGNVGIGTTTNSARLHVSKGKNATTTITIGELGSLGAGAKSKTCINMNTASGSPASYYLNAAGTAFVIETKYCL